MTTAANSSRARRRGEVKPVYLLASFAGLAVASHWLGEDVSAQINFLLEEQPHQFDWAVVARFAIPVVLLVGCAVVLHGAHVNVPRHRRPWGHRLGPVASAAFFVFACGWTAQELRGRWDWLRPGYEGSLPHSVGEFAALLLPLVLLGLALCCLYIVRRQIVAILSGWPEKATAEPREHLILFLSWLSDLTRLDEKTGVPRWNGLTLGYESLAKDIDALKEWKRSTRKQWPWEMQLSAIHHHVKGGTLRAVTLICSPESSKQADWFLRLLGKYKELNSIRVNLFLADGRLVTLTAENAPRDDSPADRWTPAWDFEDFNRLSSGLIELLDQLNREGTPDERIMIDMTGGEKPTTVVAAAATYNRAVHAQYVRTNPEWEVVGYDLGPEREEIEEGK
jgi:hypothetical protein